MSGKASGSLLVIAVALVAFLAGVLSHRSAAPVQETANDRLNTTGILRCGYILFPPYIEKDTKTGRLKGVAYDLIEGIGQTLNKKIDWAVEIPVGGEIPELEKGGIDAVCAITGGYDANTFSQLSFSDYIFTIKNRIYARADDKRFDGPLHLSDLDKPDYKFAAIEGDPSYIFPHMLMPHAQMETHPALSGPPDLFQDVKYGKADLTMLESFPGNNAMQSNRGVFKIVDLREDLPAYAMQIAFLKRDAALRDTLNETIRFMKLNGQFEPILSKYDSTGQVLFRAN